MSSPHQHPPLRRTRTAAVVLGAAVALALTGCGAGSDTSAANNPTASATTVPKGVITKQAAEKVLDTYEKVNNRANQSRDEKLLATVEGGQVHEQSRADYKVFKTWSAKDQKEYGSPFYYKNRTYYLPTAGTATWFAVKATASGSDSDALLIFDKVGGTYKLTASVYSDEAIPKIAVDGNGLATAVDASKKSGTMAPAQVGAAYEDFFVTGGKKASTQFVSTKTSQGSVKVYKERNEGKLKKYADHNFFAADPTYPKVYALKLADGGVVAVFPTAHTEERILKPAYRSSFQLGPDDDEAIFDSSKRVVITDEFQGQGLVELPAQGKPEVTAIDYRMVDSR